MDKKRIPAIVIGYRDNGEKFNIGGALVRRFPSKGYEAIGIATTKTVQVGSHTVQINRSGDHKEVLARLDEMCDKPDIVFDALPPMDKGEVALAYKLHYLERGIPVVSAEKRAMAFHPRELLKYLPILGFDAMVGGNARLITESRLRRVRHDKVKILMVVNGTANNDLCMVGDGHALATACEISAKLGYAEPDKDTSDGPLRQLRGEIYGDIPAKAAVYHALACVGADGPFFTPDDIKVKEFGTDDLDRYTDGATRYRYFVEFTNTKKRSRFNGKAPGSFYLERGDWRICGGFANVPRGTFYGDWAPDGVDNGMLIEYVEGHNGPVQLAAPGAGWGPTTDTMFQNGAQVLNLPY